MENLIGQKYYNRKKFDESREFVEYEVSEIESISDKIIIYTTSNESFVFDDLEISPGQIISEIKKDENLKKAFESHLNINCDMEKCIREFNKKTKTKTFKIFGWTIILSKSK